MENNDNVEMVNDYTAENIARVTYMANLEEGSYKYELEMMELMELDNINKAQYYNII